MEESLLDILFEMPITQCIGLRWKYYWIRLATQYPFILFL